MPESPETIAALKATIAAQAETIIWFKWAIGILCSVIAAICSFFVAWIRSLWDQRVADGEAETKARDVLLERVLAACGIVASAVEELRRQSPKGGGG